MPAAEARLRRQVPCVAVPYPRPSRLAPRPALGSAHNSTHTDTKARARSLSLPLTHTHYLPIILNHTQSLSLERWFVVRGPGAVVEPGSRSGRSDGAEEGQDGLEEASLPTAAEGVPREPSRRVTWRVDGGASPGASGPRGRAREPEDDPSGAALAAARSCRAL
jgi:hypothetical protein